MATINKNTSRYALTPITDYYLDLWNPVELSRSEGDIEIEISPSYHHRPDLLAYDQYGTTRLWWVFALRNMDILIDPINDFASGTIIIMPSLYSVEGFK